MISIIVARAKNGVIGSKNDLPWYLPADLKRFRELTTGNTVVMGRKTYESIVARLGHTLPDRRNIVLTRDETAAYDGAEILHDIDAVKQLDGDVFVIGGAEIYNQLLPLADRLYITDVKADIDGDTFFPTLDTSVWHEISREAHERDEKNQYDFDFVLYERLT